MEKIVYIVHGIDTEGPLYESIEATFLRVKNTFGIEIEANYINLSKLRSKEIDLDGKEEVVSKFLSPELYNYNDTWDKIDTMLSKMMKKDFRDEMLDSFGNGWIYNWFCLDHVGFDINPRRRDMGYHSVHDRYLDFIDKYDSKMDDVQWHFHPLSNYKEANRCATSYENSYTLHQVLSRRIIERNFFPSVYRAGFEVERPDSHWFLEQYIPYDCSNCSMEDWSEFEEYNHTKNGRMQDWRMAPYDWSIYRPDFYNYKKIGECNRYIGRFLHIKGKMANLSQEEVNKAFSRADNGEPTLMGFTNHDFRDMAPEVNIVRDKIKIAKELYPDVKFKFATAKEAFTDIVHKDNHENIKLDVKLYKEDDVFKLSVHTVEGNVFGPQPYLAIKTKSGNFLHDNLDFGLDEKSWFYVFDEDSILTSDLDKIGIAANNKFGETFIKVIDANECS